MPENKLPKLLNTVINNINICFQWIRKHKSVRWIINISLGFILLLYLAKNFGRDWELIRQVELSFDASFLGYSLLLYGLNYLLLVQSWYFLMRHYLVNVGWLKNASMFSLSYLMRFLPSPAWFITSRLVLYTKSGMQKSTILKTTGIEVLIQVLTCIAFYGLIKVDFSSVLSLLNLLLIGPLFIVIVWPQCALIKWIFSDSSNLKSRDLFFISFPLVLTWGLAGAFFYCVLRIIFPESLLNLNDLWQVWCISNLAAYLSAYVLGGIGMFREYSLTFLLSQWYSAPLSLVIAAVVRIIMTIGGILWAGLFVGIDALLNLKKQKNTL